MRDFNKIKAEILRRSNSRISARKKRNRQILTASLSFCFVAVISVALISKFNTPDSYDFAEGGAPTYGNGNEFSLNADDIVNENVSCEADHEAKEDIIEEKPTVEASTDISESVGFIEESASNDEYEADEAFLFAKLKYQGLDYYLTDEKEFNKLSKILNEILKNGEINEPADEGQLPQDETNDSITITVYEKGSEREKNYIIKKGRLYDDSKAYKVDDSVLKKINQIFFVEK